jgi:hypothetical protein
VQILHSFTHDEDLLDEACEIWQIARKTVQHAAYIDGSQHKLHLAWGERWERQKLRQHCATWHAALACL